MSFHSYLEDVGVDPNRIYFHYQADHQAGTLMLERSKLSSILSVLVKCRRSVLYTVMDRIEQRSDVDQMVSEEAAKRLYDQILNAKPDPMFRAALMLLAMEVEMHRTRHMLDEVVALHIDLSMLDGSIVARYEIIDRVFVDEMTCVTLSS